MRVSLHLTVLVAALSLTSCADDARNVPMRGPGPHAIPPPPSRPKIEGLIEAVSSADIREVIRLKQEEMVKEYGKVLPIYTVRVHSKNHIELQYWRSDGAQFVRDAYRIKGKWKLDIAVTVIG